jgi:Tol biopolymer transport system component
MKWRTAKSSNIRFSSATMPKLLEGCGVLARVIATLLIFAPAIAVRLAIAQTTRSTAAGVRLEAGIEKEDVDGDLKSAMTIYEKIAADASAPREVRAKALLRLAGCDEKLGKQAKQVYEEIVHDYGDQPAAAQARSRLVAIRQQEHPAPPETMNVRKIDREKLGLFGPEDTDGLRATYIAPDGNLYFGDISGHTKSLVYGPADPEFRRSPAWEVSRDLSIVALMLPQTKDRPATLAVIKTDGTGYRELQRNDQSNVINQDQVRWSWDDRSLLVYNPYTEDTCPRLWLVSVADGKRRELAHEESIKCIARAAFSPDGQFVAYEVWPNTAKALPTFATSKVFVVPIQGGQPRLAYESEPWPDSRFPFGALADWTADGRYLAVIGSHEGRHALFLLPMKSGVANGPPIFARAGEFDDAWSTLSGKLIFMDPGDPAWHLGSIDPDGKIGNWARIEVNRRQFPTTLPSFSPDASQIAYPARNSDSSSTDLIVKDIATGRERVVYRSNFQVGITCQYSANRSIVFCNSNPVGETGRIAKTDLLSVSVDSGAAEQIATFPDARYLLRRPQDGKDFYFAKIEDKGDVDLARWDRSTQKETPLAGAVELGDYHWTISQDGRWILRQNNGSLSFRPASGGEWKALASGIENDFPLGTTPDSNWALYVASGPEGHPGLFEAPFSGEAPRRIGDLPSGYVPAYCNFVFSPDGRRILAMNSVNPSDDLWVLENFEPKPSK